MTVAMPRASASPEIRARSSLLAATPPPSTMPCAPTPSAARMVLVVSTSTTLSWNPHANSATTASGSSPSRMSSGRPASARARATIRRAAVLRPENETSNESPSQARGNTRSRAVASAPRREIAGPPG